MKIWTRTYGWNDRYTVKFHPADIAGTFDVDMTNTSFIVERQSDWVNI